MSTILKKKELEAHNKKILSLLADLGGERTAPEEITFQGDKIILPAGTSIKQNIKFLQDKDAADQAMTRFAKIFDYRPWDGAVCMERVFQRTFGGVIHKGQKSFWFSEPPMMITVKCGVGETMQVPWGVFSLPIFPNSEFVLDAFHHEEKGLLFSVNVQARKKDRFKIEGLFNLIEEELRTNSIYRGKAIDGQQDPDFVDVWAVNRSQVVYSNEVMAQLGANVWSQLRHPEIYERLGIPFKRAVLLHGAFGTGKTLACMLTGQEAISNGITFIRVRPGKDNIMQSLQTARLYQPAVVFAEDVDILVDAEQTERNMISQVLDSFDGIDAKGAKVLCILTTNYPERIHGGMVRPGRLDAEIEIGDLDQDGVRKLVEVRIGDLLDENIDWAKVFEAAEGYKPAFVTEMAERAVRYLVDTWGDPEGLKIGTEELVNSALGMRTQYNRMLGAKDTQIVDEMGTATKKAVDEVLRERLSPKVLVSGNGS